MAVMNAIEHEADALVQFWSRLAVDEPYIHPADNKVLSDKRIDLRRYGIQTNLLPQPWVGPIRTARAFILQLNPGFSEVEIDFENSNSDFRDALWLNLGGNLPNIFLDPRFTSHPGQRWVMDVLKGVAAIRRLACEVAQVELFPYHSKSFSDVPGAMQRLLLDLPSVNVIRNWVHKTILPAAMSGQIIVVVQRRSKDWAIDSRHISEKVVVYKGGECQGGYVTANTRGGRAIQRHLVGSAGLG